MTTSDPHWCDEADDGPLASQPPGAAAQVVVLGLNHRTAPIEVRERLAFSGARLRTALDELASQPSLREVAILSTCNRAEVYVATTDAVRAADAVTAFLAAAHDGDAAVLTPHLYHLAGPDAARHLFRVAAGLDSMVLGEGQILAQVKAALLSAGDAGTAQTVLQELFQRGLALGKRARTETEIHRGAVSISSAAVDLAISVFGNLAGREALVIGAGEMSEQTLKHLVAHGVASVVVANRTHQRAVELAEQYQGRAVTFEEFGEHLAVADIVVSSSAAPHPILTVAKLQPYLPRRRGRPMFIVDIAVPRDVEAAVGELDNVYLFDIDDLSGVAERYRQEREREAVKVEQLVAAELAAFVAWLEGRQALPLVVELREHVEALRDAELDRAMRRLGHLGEADREVVRQMMRSFANKLLHGPLTDIRRHAGEPDAVVYASWVRRLFRLGRSGDQR